VKSRAASEAALGEKQTAESRAGRKVGFFFWRELKKRRAEIRVEG
jgi:hypothetical protein